MVLGRGRVFDYKIGLNKSHRGVISVGVGLVSVACHPTPVLAFVRSDFDDTLQDMFGIGS